MVKPWNNAKIGDFLDFKNGLNKGKAFFGYGTPIVNYTDVYKKRGLKKNDVRGKVSLTRDEIHRFDAQKNDVFFTRTSETPEEVGMPSVLLDDIDDCVFSGFVLRGRPKNDMFAPEYCKYCFVTEAVRSAIIMGCTYTTRALTNGKQLSAIEIVVPPKPEQEAIAQSLTDIDELIFLLEKLVAKKKAIKQGAMQELLTGKKRLPGFSGDWICAHIESCLTEKPSYGINAPAVDYNGFLPRYIRITDISEDGKYSKENQASVNAENVEPYILKHNDIVLARTGASVGKSYLYNEENGRLVYAGFLIKISIDPQKADSRLIFGVLHTHDYWKWVAQTSMRSGQPGINGEEYASYEFQMPSDLNEQKAIADILSNMGDEIEMLEKKLAKYRQIKQGMMQQLLTGKIRLV